MMDLFYSIFYFTTSHLLFTEIEIFYLLAGTHPIGTFVIHGHRAKVNIQGTAIQP